MPLSAGTLLGPYAILAPLGAGGMGEVYRARDTRLGREIALKVLPADVAADPSRRQRFEQEARAASALNHPNILSIYDVGSESGVAFMVSELIEGESLRNVIERGPVAIRKLLDIAVQMTDGLSAAHAAGIVHRDLKPENVMLNRDGRLKILDFGLAKQAPASRSEADATVTVLNTEAGVILGTVAYMSPEQARGVPADFRSDQFSCGLILYELATGKNAFQRDTAAETMAAILRDEPHIADTALAKAPVHLRWVVERCLAKDAVERYGHTSDLYRELRGLREHLSEVLSQSPTRPEGTAPTAHPRRTRRLMRGIGALLAAVAAGFLIALLLIPVPVPGMALYRFVPFATEDAYETDAAWSPDGQTIAYSAEVNGVFQIFLRSVAAPTPVSITRSADSCRQPFWSPDGTRIYYSSRDGSSALWSVGVSGGAPQKVVSDVYRAAISPDGQTIAFLRFESMDATTIRLGLWISSPPGAPPRKFEPPPISGMRYYNAAIQFAPDGKKLGFWMLMWDGTSEFWLLPLPSGQPTQPFLSWRAMVPIDQFRWFPDSRHIVFPYRQPDTAGIHLWTADIENAALRQITSGSGSEREPSISADGRRIAFTAYESQGDLVEIPLAASGMRTMVTSSRNESAIQWSPDGLEYVYVTDRSGVPEIWLGEKRTGRVWPIVTQKEFRSDITRRLEYPAFSPDGQRIAFSRFGTVQGKSAAIWTIPISGGTPVRAVQESEENPQMMPSWSPDGNSIVFINSRSGVVALAKAAVGGGAQSMVLKEKVPAVPAKWSPKGDWILYRMPDSLSLIAADGKTDRVLRQGKWDLYDWSKDGTKVYAIRSAKSHYTLSAIGVPDGAEKTLSEFDLPPGTRFGDDNLSLSPDGKTVDGTLYRTKGDIWLLEGFHLPGGFLSRFRRW